MSATVMTKYASHSNFLQKKGLAVQTHHLMCDVLFLSSFAPCIVALTKPLAFLCALSCSRHSS